MQNEKWLTAQEVADMLSIKRKRVYELACGDTLPCLRVGPRIIRFKATDIENFIKENYK